MVSMDELYRMMTNMMVCLQRLEDELSKLKSQEQSSELMTKHEVAVFFGVNELTIDRWCKENVSFPTPISINPNIRKGSLRWRRKDILSFVDELFDMSAMQKELMFKNNS